MTLGRKLIAAAISESLKVLGFERLRPRQDLAVTSFLKGQDVFVSLSTGSGKSLCYWALPHAFDYIRKKSNSMILVVSPLVALMQDQVSVLVNKGIRAVEVGSASAQVEEEIRAGRFQVLFFSPECLLTRLDWRDVLFSSIFQDQLIAFIVDEAHCVKQW